MKPKPMHKRFDKLFIAQHFILLTCVLLLIASGLPMKFPYSPVSRWLVWLQGGMEMRSHIHHGAGLTLIGLGVFHFLYYMVFKRKRPGHRWNIVPRPRDAVDLYHHMLYVLGLRRELPRMGRFTWYEKFDYLGLMWGIGVMGLTGLSMLYMSVALRFISLSWLQVLWAAHSEEAMLATLFLLIIHMYHVHFNPEKFPMSLTWLNGKLSREEMEKYHPLELQDLENDARVTSSDDVPPTAGAPALDDAGRSGPGGGTPGSVPDPVGQDQ